MSGKPSESPEKEKKRSGERERAKGEARNPRRPVFTGGFDRIPGGEIAARASDEDGDAGKLSKQRKKISPGHARQRASVDTAAAAK